MQINERVQLLNDKTADNNGKYVLYWMQMFKRVSENHALNFAINQANERRPARNAHNGRDAQLRADAVGEKHHRLDKKLRRSLCHPGTFKQRILSRRPQSEQLRGNFVVFRQTRPPVDASPGFRHDSLYDVGFDRQEIRFAQIYRMDENSGAMKIKTIFRSFCF